LLSSATASCVRNNFVHQHHNMFTPSSHTCAQHHHTSCAHRTTCCTTSHTCAQHHHTSCTHRTTCCSNITTRCHHRRTCVHTLCMQLTIISRCTTAHCVPAPVTPGVIPKLSHARGGSDVRVEVLLSEAGVCSQVDAACSEQ
jgi:hypothetical protein